MRAHTDIAVAFTETEAIIVETCLELVAITLQQNPVQRADPDAIAELERIRDKIRSARIG